MDKNDLQILVETLNVNEIIKNINRLFIFLITAQAIFIINIIFSQDITKKAAALSFTDTLEIKLINNTQNSQEYKNMSPGYIYFPTHGKKIEIEHTFINDETYHTFENKANHVRIENDSIGKDIIFAHATNNLFNDITDLNLNSIFYIENETIINVYELKLIETVLPDDFDLVYKQSNDELKIFTCAGENDEFRQLLSAKLVNSYSKGEKGEI